MMISRRYFIGICFSLMAGFWYTPGAFAQARPASPQPEDAGHPTIAEASRATPWDTIQWVERRYKIEAMRFKARDETGVDWWGSDEVMVQTNDAKGSTVSNEIGGIDSGDTHNFDPAKSCIVAVRPGVVVLGESSVCDEVGEPAPLGFQVEFWEKDFRITAVWVSSASGTRQDRANISGPWWADDEFDDDDFIGSAQIDYPTQELEAALPNVGDEVDRNRQTGSLPRPDLRRLPRLHLYLARHAPARRAGRSRLVLDEAMQRSGARSELEAIATGLRSLRAPSPRKIEPKRAIRSAVVNGDQD